MWRIIEWCFVYIALQSKYRGDPEPNLEDLNSCMLNQVKTFLLNRVLTWDHGNLFYKNSIPWNMRFGYFTPLFCRGWQRKVPKFKMHVQNNCLLNQLFCGIAIALVCYGPALLDSKLGNLMKECSVVMLNYLNLLDPRPSTCPLGLAVLVIIRPNQFITTLQPSADKPFQRRSHWKSPLKDCKLRMFSACTHDFNNW